MWKVAGHEIILMNGVIRKNRNSRIAILGLGNTGLNRGPKFGVVVKSYTHLTKSCLSK